jgi:hypothetical protein
MLRNCRQGQNRLRRMVASGLRWIAGLRFCADRLVVRATSTREWFDRRYSPSSLPVAHPSANLSYRSMVAPGMLSGPSSEVTAQERLRVSTGSQASITDMAGVEPSLQITAQQPSSGWENTAGDCPTSPPFVQKVAPVLERPQSAGPRLSLEGVSPTIRVGSWSSERGGDFGLEQRSFASSFGQQSFCCKKQLLRHELERQFATAAGPDRGFLRKKMSELEPLLRCAKRVFIRYVASSHRFLWGIDPTRPSKSDNSTQSPKSLHL